MNNGCYYIAYVNMIVLYLRNIEYIKVQNVSTNDTFWKRTPLNITFKER